MSKRTSISLFTGAGGMDIGVSKAGFDILWANDVDADACETYQKNHDAPIVEGDLNDFVNDLSNFKDIDLIFGGPPCQGFSVAGKMNPEDERSKLIYTFMDVVDRVKPTAFIMENVKALASLDKWKPVRNKLFKKARDSGYNFTEIALLNATDYGVPQKRERMFFIGIKNTKKIHKSLKGFRQYLDQYKKKAAPVEEIFMELGPAGSKQNQSTCNAKITLAKSPVLRKSPYAGMLFNGGGRPINVKQYSNTLPASMGGNRTPIVDEKELFSNESNWVKTYHEILQNEGNPQDVTVPDRLRRITLEEAAAIQTFPESYKFCGSQNSTYSQIGNAVPCELAYAVGGALRDALDEEGL
jgi:DNA (cytosine-5)-methyltransferase 1